jgi:hypothetical protein
MNGPLEVQLLRLQKAAFLGGFVGLALCGLGAWVNPRQLFISWLSAHTFWLGLTLGCFGVAMIHHLTGGRWGMPIRRFLEAGFLTLPVMALLFIPVILGGRWLYPWLQPHTVAASHVLQHQRPYLNLTAFLFRAGFLFGVWTLLALYLRRWSVEQDRVSEPEPTVRLRALSGPGLVIYPLTVTFACVDWVMSIEPEWYSTIFPLILLVGQILSAFAFVIVVAVWTRRSEPFSHVMTTQHFHDLGNLLLTFVIFWTYLAFSQLLIIYSGNLPHEIKWYLHRIAGSWRWVVVGLAVFHFFVPFLLLLFREVKRKTGRLVLVSVLVLAGQAGAVFWTIAPTFHPAGIDLHWLDAAAMLGLGGLWLGSFAHSLRRAAILPLHDPRAEYPNRILAPYAQ